MLSRPISISSRKIRPVVTRIAPRHVPMCLARKTIASSLTTHRVQWSMSLSSISSHGESAPFQHCSIFDVPQWIMSPSPSITRFAASPSERATTRKSKYNHNIYHGQYSLNASPLHNQCRGINEHRSKLEMSHLSCPYQESRCYWSDDDKYIYEKDTDYAELEDGWGIANDDAIKMGDKRRRSHPPPYPYNNVCDVNDVVW